MKRDWILMRFYKLFEEMEIFPLIFSHNYRFVLIIDEVLKQGIGGLYWSQSS